MSSYKAKSIRELRNKLKFLKARKANTVDIKFVPTLLRKNLQKADATRLDSGYYSNIVHHNQFMGKNFWEYVKTFFKQEANTSPSVTKETCSQFFNILLYNMENGICSCKYLCGTVEFHRIDTFNIANYQLQVPAYYRNHCR